MSSNIIMKRRERRVRENLNKTKIEQKNHSGTQTTTNKYLSRYHCPIIIHFGIVNKQLGSI